MEVSLCTAICKWPMKSKGNLPFPWLPSLPVCPLRSAALASASSAPFCSCPLPGGFPGKLPDFFSDLLLNLLSDLLLDFPLATLFSW